MNRILVIRGGAIGDFILTLPTLKVLREHFSAAHLELLGHSQIISLAENRYYADTTRSIDSISLASFFVEGSELTDDLAKYFAGFDLIVSYLFDPDQIFFRNLRRSSSARIVMGSPKFNDRDHAVRQLATPLAELGLQLTAAAPILYPSEADRAGAQSFFQRERSPLIAIHAGSGSGTKNWPIENWIALKEELRDVEAGHMTLAVIGGEADETEIARLRSVWGKSAVHFVINWPLPQLAALLDGAIFVGHDSGISHLAAAAGARCVVLFGPTDPAIWAPLNEGVRVVRAPSGNLEELRVEIVRDAVVEAWTQMSRLPRSQAPA